MVLGDCFGFVNDERRGCEISVGVEMMKAEKGQRTLDQVLAKISVSPRLTPNAQTPTTPLDPTSSYKSLRAPRAIPH